MKKIGQTGGGEYHGACPFCGGTDRFIVQPNSGNGGHWWCRQCGKSGDPVAFIMQYDNLDFKAAVEQLGATHSDPPRKNHPEPKPELHVNDLRDDYPCFEPAWQQAASDFAYECGGELWDSWNTSAAGRYLEARGINRDTAVAECLGLNKSEYRATWGSVEVWLPRGITIPWNINTQFWNIRVRRPNADLKATGGDKYISSKGCANGLYSAYHARPNATVIMTEGEFDALVVNRFFRQRESPHVGAVSIGSCTGARVLRWITLLSLAERVLIAFDNDPAGDQAAQYWLAALHPKAKRLRPSRKDITEVWQAGELAGFLGDIA
jgi:DNA primase